MFGAIGSRVVSTLLRGASAAPYATQRPLSSTGPAASDQQQQRSNDGEDEEDGAHHHSRSSSRWYSFYHRDSASSLNMDFVHMGLLVAAGMHTGRIICSALNEYFNNHDSVGQLSWRLLSPFRVARGMMDRRTFGGGRVTASSSSSSSSNWTHVASCGFVSEEEEEERPVTSPSSSTATDGTATLLDKMRSLSLWSACRRLNRRAIDLHSDSQTDAARRYWKEAASAGYTPAMFNLGLAYDLARVTTKAERWYREAACRDHALAAYNLGVLLAGRPGSTDEGYALIKRAATSGVPEARLALSQVNTISDSAIGNSISTAEPPPALSDFAKACIESQVASSSKSAAVKDECRHAKVDVVGERTAPPLCHSSSSPTLSQLESYATEDDKLYGGEPPMCNGGDTSNLLNGLGFHKSSTFARFPLVCDVSDAHCATQPINVCVC